jgi:hypothetical protein
VSKKHMKTKNDAVKTAPKLEPVKSRLLPVHLNPMRQRGPSYPQKKRNGPWEAVSFNNRTGLYMRTHHDSREKAEKRLAGNPRHGNHHIIDHVAEYERAEVRDKQDEARKAERKRAKLANEYEAETREAAE